MSFFYKRLPDKGNCIVYQVRKKLFLLFQFISLIAVIISGWFLSENLYLIIIPFLVGILYLIGAFPAAKVFFGKKKMKREGGGIFDFKKPTIFYIEK